MNNKANDITQTGAKTAKELQDQNSERENLEFLKQLFMSRNDIEPLQDAWDLNNIGPREEQSPLLQRSLQNGTNDYWGNSIWDDEIATEEQWRDLDNTRGENQPWYAQVGAGLFKGTVLAGTTFVDGTLGLIYGAGSAIYNGITNDNESGWESFSRLWNNDVSNALQDINAWAESAAPNYMTNEERNRPWYMNMGTANFWADKVLKNAGFMVGAFYSGGAWSKGIKFGGTTAHRVLGSLMQGVNEARIESNNMQRDATALEYKKAAEALGISEQTLLENPYYANVLSGINEGMAKGASLNFFIQTPFLAFDDLLLYAKMYSRGFSNAKDVANQVEKSNWLSRAKNNIKERIKTGEKLSLKDKAGIIFEEGKYAAKDFSWKKSAGKAILTAGREGNEEMFQQFSSNLGGNLYAKDSPDAYYDAIKDPNAIATANSFMGSVIKSFNESYGDPDQWEQFAVGVISSAIGMPTFGKVNNSDANTWLGKGWSVGLSGGIFGNMRSDYAAHQEALKTVGVMNKTLETLKNNQLHYAQAKVFTDAMDGFSEEDDKFEYKNAESNLDFATIQAFSNAGRMDDLKELVEASFSPDMSAEELGKIALYNSKKDKDGKLVSGWLTATGEPMATQAEDGTVEMSEANQAEMRKQLQDKKEKTIKQIEAYEKSVQLVRGIGNNSLTDAEVQELAWLHWKGQSFTERYKEILNNNKGTFEDFYSALSNMEDQFLEERKNLTEDTYTVDDEGNLVLDEKSKPVSILTENSNMLAAIRTFKTFIENVRDSNKPLLLASFLKDNEGLEKFLKDEAFFNFVDAFSYKTGMDFGTYEEALQDLIDCERLAKASEEFNNRYKEFVSDPLSIKSKRKKKEERQEAQRQIKENSEKRNTLNKSKVSDIVRRLDDGESSDDMEGLFEGEEEQQSGKKKVQEAKKIINKRDAALAEAKKKLEEGKITEQQYKDIVKQITKASKVSESVDELTDLSSITYEDPLTLLDEDEVMDPKEEESLTKAIEERNEEAKAVTQEIFDTLKAREQDTEDLPKETSKEELDSLSNEIEEGKKDVGHDSTSDLPSEAEREKKLELIKAKASYPNLIRYVEEFLKNRGFSDSDIEAIRDDLLNLLHATYVFGQQPDINTGEPIGYSSAAVIVFTGNRVLSAEMTSAVLEAIERWENELIIEEKGVTVQTTELAPVYPTSKEKAQQDSDDTASSTNNAISVQNYWIPATSEVAFGEQGKSGKPFFEVADKNKYTPEQLKRFKTIWEYLNSKGAFENAFNLKEGDKITFVVDPKLNEAAGTFTVLLYSNGKLVGDLLTFEDTFALQRKAGLKSVLEEIEQEYKEWEKSKKDDEHLFESKKFSTNVAHKMIGRVLYTDESHSLNEIHTNEGTIAKFKLGIDVGNKVTASSRKEEASSKDSVLRPRHSTKGQPFLLIPTGAANKNYMAVPFIMRTYNGQENTALDKIIGDLIRSLKNVKSGEELKFIHSLQELFYLPIVHLDVDKQGNINFRVEDSKGKVLLRINSNTNNPNLEKLVKDKLKGTPYQISIQYINGTYKGQDYNQLIGEIATCNIPIGFTHLASSWFTMNPIVEGKTQKASMPRAPKVASTGTNNTIKVVLDGITYTVKGDTFDTVRELDSKGLTKVKSVSKSKANIVRALAYINKNHIVPNNEGLVETPWGSFNTKTNSFIKKETTKEEQKTTEVKKDYDELANKYGLLTDVKSKRVFAKLDDTAKEKLFSYNQAEVKKLFKKLCDTFKLGKGFTKDPNSILDEERNRETTEGDVKPINVKEEVKWLNKVLPQLSTRDRLRIVNALIKISNSHDSARAWGQFKKGVIYLSRKGARGTLYHEAFHAVVNLLLTESEINTLFEEAKNTYGNMRKIALEEKLAEDFRKYVQTEQMPVVGTLVRMFRTLKHIIKSMLGKETFTENLFYRIQRGQLANRKPSTSNVTRNRTNTYEIQEKIRLLDEHYKNAQKGRAYRDTLVADTKEELKKHIEGMEDVLYIIQDAYGRFRIACISKKTYEKKRKALQDQLEQVYEAEKSEDQRKSEEALREQEEAEERYEQEFDDHYKNKYRYETLSEEEIKYMETRGVSREELEKMTPEGKESFFYCKM